VGKKDIRRSKTQNSKFFIKGWGCVMLSFLIKEQKCLYRNIPVIKFCYMSEERRRRESERKSRASKDPR